MFRSTFVRNAKLRACSMRRMLTPKTVTSAESRSSMPSTRSTARRSATLSWWVWVGAGLWQCYPDRTNLVTPRPGGRGDREGVRRRGKWGHQHHAARPRAPGQPLQVSCCSNNLPISFQPLMFTTNASVSTLTKEFKMTFNKIDVNRIQIMSSKWK